MKSAVVHGTCGPANTGKWCPSNEVAPHHRRNQQLHSRGVMAWSWATHDRFRSTADRLLLLVPDGISFSDPKVAMWLDAGSEEGLHVVRVHDSEFLRPLWGKPNAREWFCRIPSTSRRVIFSSPLCIVCRRRRETDAGLRCRDVLAQRRFAAGRSRLSDLAGVDYALYDKLAGKTIQWSRVTSTNAIVGQLEIPPGKYYPFHTDDTQENGQSLTPRQKFRGRTPALQIWSLPVFQLSNVRITLKAKFFFSSSNRLVVGQHSYQKGSVLLIASRIFERRHPTVLGDAGMGGVGPADGGGMMGGCGRYGAVG